MTAGSPDPAGTTAADGDEAGSSTWVETVVGGLSADDEPEVEVMDAEIVDAEIVDDQPLGAEAEESDVEPEDLDVIDVEPEDLEVVEIDDLVDETATGLAPDIGGAGQSAPDIGGAGQSAPDIGGAGQSAPDIGGAGQSAPADISVEDLVADLERVTAERDQYLDASRRLQAEFENYKKQVAKREQQARERANDGLIGELLPVLDAFDGAIANGAADVEPMRVSFLDALAKQGLERIDPVDAPFDPNQHEAVLHEDASDTDGPVVAEVMRAGYAWKGRVLRPAMVRTRG